MMRQFTENIKIQPSFEAAMMETDAPTAKIAITATFTAELVEESLTFWMRELELPFKIEFAPYNQVFQQLLAPDSLLAQNQTGINIILVRFEDWLRFEEDNEKALEASWPEDALEKISRNVQDLIIALKSAATGSSTPHIVCLCPSAPVVKADSNKMAFCQQMEEIMVSQLAGVSGLYLMTTVDLAAYEVENYYDPLGDKLGHIPFTPLFFTALGSAIARKIYAIKSAPYKVIVLDCDHTLWKGVVGEDGVMGIEIATPWKKLQEFIVQQQKAGMLICLCSKNNEADVVEVFEQRKEMPLQREQIVAWRINWLPKSENIKSLAAELNLGLDSFIFIDDNPIECAEVQASCPQVLTLQLPSDGDIPKFLNHVWAFDRLKITQEDLQRTALYKQNLERDRFAKQTLTIEEFLAGLNLKVEISSPLSSQLSRVSQLTQRTNQFNLTTIRRELSEIQQLSPSGFECRVVQVSDRFGDYGLVGVMIFSTDSNALNVDTFLLSCRVLGRGVEHRMLTHLAEIAKERNKAFVKLSYIPTPKNLPALQFLESVAADFKQPQDNCYYFNLPVEFTAAVSYTPGDTTNSTPSLDVALKASVAGGEATPQTGKSAKMCRIANELYSAEQVLNHIESQQRQSRQIQQPFVAPNTETQQKLAELWTQVLRVEQVGIHDNFFELGGTSLLATQVISRVRNTLQVELPLHEIFKSPTVAAWAELIETLHPVEPSLQALPILPGSRKRNLPLSFAQQRIWFFDQLEAGNTAYNISKTIQIAGSLDVIALEQSINEILQRHESLRTSFRIVDGQPTQVISPTLTVSLPVVNLRLTETERESEVLRLATEEAQWPFDLVQGPLMRVKLLRLAQENHVLILTWHHIVFDGWSLGVFLQELAILYKAFLVRKPSSLAALPIQYADYAIWQRQWLQGEVFSKQLAYWKQQLCGNLPVLQLPTDRPRPPVQSYRGARQSILLPKPITDALKVLSHQEGVTEFMTLLAAFKTLLYRYTGQSDILVGLPIANRNWVEFEALIGFFVNTLVLRTDLSGNPSFQKLLGRVREVALGAYAHQDIPFEQLVEQLQPQRDLSRTPLFQVMFVFQNNPMLTTELPGLTLNPFTVESQTAKFDLTWLVEETQQGLEVACEYDTDLFDRSTIERMLGHFQTLLEGIVACPDAPISTLPILTATEQHQLLVEWNNTNTDAPQDTCIHQLFEAQVEQTPDAVAVVFENEQLTYRELNAKANQLAHYLQALGVGLEVLVGICVERSLEMVVGLLGILKAGGAYVPLDPAYPQERLAFMLADASVSVLLTQQRLVPGLPKPSGQIVCLDSQWASIAQFSADKPVSSVNSSNLAYTIYTSGSTGKPKGVLVPHRGLCNLALAQIELFDAQPNSRVLQFASFSFDASISEVVMAVCAGAQLHLATKDSLLPGPALRQLLHDQAISHVTLPPSALAVLPPEKLPALQTLVVAGEACASELVAQWSEGRRFCNAYGPTEATVCATVAVCTNHHHKPPIGRPIANTQVYILDSHLQPVPIGIPGELHIAGIGLARGYLNRPQLNAEKFITNPFSEQPGARLYKTGDLSRYLPDGNIEYLGRLDHQVKIRGFRIELGEIEAVLSQHPDVLLTVVIAREDIPGERRLVAYLVAKQQPVATSSELQCFLKQQLPEYMVPSAFVVLEAIPLTPNGKVDRRALPMPDYSRDQQAGAIVAPRNLIEEVLVAIWCDVLHLNHLSIHDNFFALGGHSLLATKIMARVCRSLRVELPLRHLFEAPTIAELAQRIETVRQAALGRQTPPLVLTQRECDIPLSFAQQRLWFLNQLESHSAVYNVPVSLHLKGQLHLAVLESSLNEIQQRHESLRTVFVAGTGTPVAVVCPEVSWQLEVVDLQQLPETQRCESAQQLAMQEVQQPFHLEQGPLWRAKLLQLAEDEYVLIVTLHHIVCDEWSLKVLMQELATLYETFLTQQSSPLPALPIQYADYAIWQRQWLQDEVLAKQLTYWQQKLAGAPVALELPTDRPRPPVQTYTGAWQAVVVSESLTQALKQLSRQHSATLFMTLLAAFKTLLYRYSGQSDIVVGTPITNRHHQELEGLIGFFLNTLVLRTDLSHNPSFSQVLERVREVALEAYAHQDLPFEQLVEQLQPDRDMSRSPLFQVMFVLQHERILKLELPGLTLNPFMLESQVAKFDLTLFVADTEPGLAVSCEYNTDLFDSSTIEQMLGHFQTLLEGIVTNPEQPISLLPILTAAEQHQSLVEWNNTNRDYPQACIHQLFEAQVQRTPDAVAVVFEEQQLTYQQLNNRANQLAHYLQALGVGPEVLVGICVERSLEMVVGLLGILKAGGAYVPLDPAYPQERLAFMLEDSQVPVLLTQQRLVEGLPKHQAQVVCLDGKWESIAQSGQDNPSSLATVEDLAYVIYTSGSTGKPKGVQIPHRAVVNFLLSMQKQPGLTNQDILLAVTSLSFDIAGLELFLPLIVGAKVVLVSREVAIDGSKLLALLQESGASVLQATPATWRLLLEAGWQGTERLKVLCGGEALSWELACRLRERTAAVWNMYGPTETTIWSTTYQVTAEEETVSIGRPIDNTQIYLLDLHLQPVPIGVTGEVYIGGAGLARGYLNRPELSAEKFIANPFSKRPGARLYKTGDLARYLPSGNIEYLGRSDQQVKMRGFRIELGEIEVVLSQHPAVQQSVVLGREDVPGDQRLVAYVVPNQELASTPSELRQFLREYLPEYMVPAAFVMLQSLPLTPNGKVDRQALPRPESVRLELKPTYVAPQSEVERTIATVWQQVLQLEQVGVHDNFFELGGHSLLMAQVHNKLQQLVEREVSMIELFRYPTINSLASYLTHSPNETPLQKIHERAQKQKEARNLKKASYKEKKK